MGGRTIGAVGVAFLERVHPHRNPNYALVEYRIALEGTSWVSARPSPSATLRAVRAYSNPEHQPMTVSGLLRSPCTEPKVCADFGAWTTTRRRPNGPRAAPACRRRFAGSTFSTRCAHGEMSAAFRSADCKRSGYGPAGAGDASDEFPERRFTSASVASAAAIVLIERNGR
jgi:hypothetical protein